MSLYAPSNGFTITSLFSHLIHEVFLPLRCVTNCVPNCGMAMNWLFGLKRVNTSRVELAQRTASPSPSCIFSTPQHSLTMINSAVQVPEIASDHRQRVRLSLEENVSSQLIYMFNMLTNVYFDYSCPSFSTHFAASN